VTGTHWEASGYIRSGPWRAAHCANTQAPNYRIPVGVGAGVLAAPSPPCHRDREYLLLPTGLERQNKTSFEGTMTDTKFEAAAETHDATPLRLRRDVPTLFLRLGMPSPRALRSFGVALLVTLSACTSPAPPPPTPPALAPGVARLWLYRAYEPNETLARPFIRLNGAPIGISEPGGTLVRDVPPGVYNVTVDSTGRDTNQFVTVTASAGKIAYVRIESSQGWETDLDRRVDTFYTREVAPDTARGG
jgi:hypothetical protein